VAVLVGIATLGTALAISGLWRKLRPIQEKNQTHETLSKLFNSILNTGEERINKENFIGSPPLGSPNPLDLVVDSFDSPEKEPFDEQCPQTDFPLRLPINRFNFPEKEPFDDACPEPHFSLSNIGEETPSRDALQQFSDEDLITFRAALSKVKAGEVILFELDDHSKFVVWYNEAFSAINIQEENYYRDGHQIDKLGIIIDDRGKITSLRINNVAKDSNRVPDAFLPQVQESFKAALRHSSHYRTRLTHHSDYAPIVITIVRRGIKEIPAFHLQKFSQVIQEAKGRQDDSKIYDDPKIYVEFLKDDLSLDIGVDQGGLSLDYLDELFDGIINSPILSFQSMESSLLVLPRTKESYQHLQPLPKLNKQEQTLYEDIGKVMMYCCQSQVVPEEWGSYHMGRHFDEALFKGVLCLTAQEIDTPFENLAVPTLLRMCEALLSADKGREDMDYLMRRIIWVETFHLLDDETVLEVARELIYADCLPIDLTLNNKGEEPDMEKIQSSKTHFLTCLTDSVFYQEGSHGQLGIQLAPLHAIAKGMKALCRRSDELITDELSWNNFMTYRSFQEVSDKIQGSLDRKTIANQMTLDLGLVDQIHKVNQNSSYWLNAQDAKGEIEKKMGWLQEWIRDEKEGATQDELKRLLKFLTASSSFPKGREIVVKAQCERPFSPVPIVHTCSFEIELAPEPSSYGKHHDHTKEEFITSLKEIALTHPSAYSMM